MSGTGVSIGGSGHTAFGRYDARSLEDLIVEAAREATDVSMHAISCRQLTGQAGEMQVEGPEFGLIFHVGGAAVANSATVLQAGPGR
ncbi:hypothetical protein ABIE69_001261 [Rhodobacteraceae bacterium MBR-64]|jgi:hypothetical protein